VADHPPTPRHHALAQRHHEVSRGVRAGTVAYGVWGFLTIYWKELEEFSPFELIGWRVTSACVVLAVVVTARRRWPIIRAAFADRRLAMRIAGAALLLTANWTSYLYAVGEGRIIETALGYFMSPLGTMILGIVVFKERPSTASRFAMVLAGVAIVVLTVSYGRVPVAGLIIAVSWSLYGAMKRQVPLTAVDSLAAETFIMVIPAVLLSAALAARTDSIPRSADAGELVLVSLAGVATVVPLVLFAFAAARVPFTILGPLNYLVPTINFLLGWGLYDEDLPLSRLVGFAFVWAALVVVTIDRLRAGVQGRRAAPAVVASTPD